MGKKARLGKRAKNNLKKNGNKKNKKQKKLNKDSDIIVKRKRRGKKVVKEDIDDSLDIVSIPVVCNENEDSVEEIVSEIAEIEEIAAVTEIVEVVEEEIVEINPEEVEPEVENIAKKSLASSNMMEQILFKLPCVLDPIIGTPKLVQKQLDKMVRKMQINMKKNINNDKIFDKIHLYMHGYLLNVVLKKFPFIRGFQTVDIYQETLIALRFKAIPNFRKNKGMSFLNFAKMCIRRHLITLLNTSNTRKKDQSMNRAVSIDANFSNNSDNTTNTLSNVLPDKSLHLIQNSVENTEAYAVTKNHLLHTLSDFEKVVLCEYLANSSYKEISHNISKKLRRRCGPKSIDNALLRIRKKADHLKKHSNLESLPMFIKK